MASTEPPVLNVHTPTSSFAIVHSLIQDSLESLYDTLSRKSHTDYRGERVGAGWLKYDWNETIWNLDDDADYTIFVWRLQSHPDHGGSTHPQASPTPTLHLHNPAQSLPTAPAYLNPAYYLFQPSRAHPPRSPRSSPKPHSSKSRGIKAGKRHGAELDGDGVPTHKKEFEKFHGENGVRTVVGSIGPVQNVRMLLKYGYRHVYISRKFAMKHAFIPADATPGHYGYSGLVSIGVWPITLTPSSSFAQSTHVDGSTRDPTKGKKKKPTLVQVYLSEEPHFDIVLGRSFIEKRQIQTNATDLTDVVCMDTGEKVECELVILKDGRGEIVTVT